MLGRLRGSLATKLLAAGLALTIALIGGTFAYLLISRDRQTTGAALSNSDNRAAVLAQAFVTFTGGQSRAAAQSLASQSAVISALNTIDPQVEATALLVHSPPVDLSGEIVIVTDVGGNVVYSHASGGGATTIPTTLPASLTQALAGSGRCSLASSTPGTACGLELIGDQPAFDVAVPVMVSGHIIGTVAYLAPLQNQLKSYQKLLDYPVAFVQSARPDRLLRFGATGSVSTDSAPSDLIASFRDQRPAIAPVHGVYATPGGDQVAGSFLAQRGPDGKVVGWLGVEAPLSSFVGDSRSDEITLGLIAALAILVTVMVVVLFVSSVVWRPISRLERGVARIAEGDYTSPIQVRSKDELGRLATSVNRMQVRIKEYVSEIEQSRATRDAAVHRISELSRALTGTASGVANLEQQVVTAAAAIAGERCSVVWMVPGEHEQLFPAAQHRSSDAPLVERLSVRTTVTVLAGERVSLPAEDGRTSTLLAVPMFSHDAVVGVLAIVGPPGTDLSGDEDVLAVLANNAAIARENARLFERERETVKRLRELDAMKTDFLRTVQHELRAPLTAILGLSDLIEMCWGMWDDPSKLEAVRDIQVAAKNLYDIVETIIDFSATHSGPLGLAPLLVAVRPAVDAALVAVGEHYKGGVGVPVHIDVAADVRVYADRDRMDQLLRALLDNAVKFSSGKGEITIRAGLRQNRMVRIQITDGGIGIPEKEISRVFDQFYQVDNSATRRFGGTGMGLALVRRLVTAHGAQVELQSRVGEGTSVIIDWPATPDAAGGEARRVAEDRGEVIADGGAQRWEAAPVQ
ncbi:MAG: ATP-binding protein [Candidatus Dormibacteria bacterium]